MIRLILAAVITLALSAGSSAQDTSAPVQFVQKVSAALDTAAQSAKTGGAGAGQSQVERVLARDFDLAAMGVAALPKEFQAAATSQYVTAYRGYLAKVFVREALRAGSGSLTVLGARQSGALMLVGTQVNASGQRGRVIEWYLAPRGASFKVVNATVESVLITQQNRRDFADPLAAGGLDGLIAFLQAGAY